MEREEEQHANWHLELFDRQKYAMAIQLAKLLGLDVDSGYNALTTPQGLAGLVGGNYNSAVDASLSSAIKDALKECENGRCGHFPTLHFHLTGNVYIAHLDAANPLSGLAGLFVHGIVDAFLGWTLYVSWPLPH